MELHFLFALSLLSEKQRRCSPHRLVPKVTDVYTGKGWYLAGPQQIHSSFFLTQKVGAKPDEIFHFF